MSSYYEPLFLKYRPQKLSDLLGQKSVKETLVNAIVNSKIVHAYLLTGPRGSGKTSTARILAKSLNCLKSSPSLDPCGLCASCIDIANSSSLDVLEIDGASHGHVDDARRLIEKVNLASISGHYRIYIIDEVHMLSSGAFNALLKIIEEPPSNVVFIMATTELEKVPQTIVSRCQQLRFKPISINDTLERLRYVANKEGININDDALMLIAKYADGAMRDALSLLDQVSVFGSNIESKNILDLIGYLDQASLQALCDGIFNRDISNLQKTLDEILVLGKSPSRIVHELMEYFLLILERGDFKLEAFELVQIIDSLSDLEINLKRSSKPQILLKSWLVKIAYRADIAIIKELDARITKLEQNLDQGNSTIKIEQVAKKNTEEKSNKLNIVSDNLWNGLSPLTQGLLTSSQASLVGIKDEIAILGISEKYKILKDRIEAKSAEIIEVLRKNKSDKIKALEVVTQDDLKQIDTPISDVKNSSKLDEASKAFKEMFLAKEI